MNIYDILFQTVSNLTGGLIVDVQTAMVGVVTILCVLMGLDFLKDALFGAIDSISAMRAMKKLHDSVRESGGDWNEYTKEENARRVKRNFHSAEESWRKYDREL